MTITLFLKTFTFFQLAATILSIPFLFPLFFMPESPRWLFSKNKNEEGKKVFLFRFL